jgi:hypothetical protein
MRTVRLIAAALLLGAAFVLAALAADVLHWREAMRTGDRAFARDPAGATWSPSTVLPASVARDVLGLEVPLRFRAAQQAFAGLQSTPSYDNGLSESQTRGALEAELAGLARSHDHAIASEADNLLGILAFADSKQSGPIAPAPVDQSVADFQTAIRLDQLNADAKFNLERLLNELRAHGVRVGPDASAGGPAKGHRGAGGGLPGRGY